MAAKWLNSLDTNSSFKPLLSCDWSVRFNCFYFFDPLFIAKKLIGILDEFRGHLLLLSSIRKKFLQTFRSEFWSEKQQTMSSSKILVGKKPADRRFLQTFRSEFWSEKQQTMSSSKILVGKKPADRKFLQTFRSEFWSEKQPTMSYFV